jgi:hypothetical protein
MKVKSIINQVSEISVSWIGGGNKSTRIKQSISTFNWHDYPVQTHAQINISFITEYNVILSI